MSMELDVLVIGTATRDVFVKSPHFKVETDEQSRTGRKMSIALGEKLEVPDVYFCTGGGGTNVAVGFARQGFKTGCVTRMGDDVSGRDIKEEFVKEGLIDLSQVDPAKPTAYSLILVAPDGERTILEHRGANEKFFEDQIDWANIRSKWLFMDSFSDNLELLKRAVDWAKNNGTKIAYNPGKKMVAMGTGLQPYLEGIDVLICNEDEASLITGIAPMRTKEIFVALDHIATEVAVMTRGPKGVIVSDKKNVYTAGIPDSPVVERTGAGDSFCSGFLSGYIETGDIKHSIQLGTANATSVVLYYGGKQGLLKRGDWGQYPKVDVQTSTIEVAFNVV